ncbi:MAG: hypothetical protein ACOCWQ_03215, partial [Nanoarchaeota archaeon]
MIDYPEWYRRIVDQITPVSSLRCLVGKTISWNCGGSSDIIGIVQNIWPGSRSAKIKIMHHLFQNKTNYSIGEASIPIFTVGDEVTYQFDDGNRQEAYRVHPVYLQPPKKIVVKSGAAVEFTYDPNDQVLENMFTKMCLEVGEIKAPDDFQRMITWLQTLPQRNQESIADYDEQETSLGEVINKYGAVCRHLVGVGYAYCLQKDLQSRMLVSSNPIKGEKHSFLNVEQLLVDPINRWVFPMDCAEHTITKLGKP